MKSSLGKRICLICPKVPDPSWGDTLSSVDQKAFGNAIRKIFEYLLIPNSEQEAIGDLVDFCPDCFTVVRDIMKMQKKIQVLELMIQYKAETLGRIVLETPMRGLVGKGKASQMMWKKFRQPVIKCFLKGYLPSPSVSLSSKQESSNGDRSDTSKTPEVPSQIRKLIPGLQSEQNSNTKKIKRPRLSNRDDDSLTSFFIKDEESNRGEDIDDNVDIESIKVEYEHTEVEEKAVDENNLEYVSDYGDEPVSPEAVDKLVPVSSECNHAEEGTSSISIFCKENQHLNSEAKTNEIPNDEIDNTVEPLKDYTEKASSLPETIEIETGKSLDLENEGELKTKELDRKRVCTRPVRSAAPKRFKYSSDEDAEESDFSDSDFEIDIDDERNEESDTCKTVDQVRSEDGDSNRSINNTQTTRKRKSKTPWTKRKQRVISGVKLVESRAPEPNKYSMQCPQCDFIATTDTMKSKLAGDEDRQLFVLYEVANHFTKCHNPIKLNNLSKSPNGNECYKCSKCEFDSRILGGSHRLKHKRYKALRDLSLHYINLHNGCKDNEGTPEVLKNLKPGIDYFKCPDTTCNFYIFAKRTEGNPSKDLKTGRMNLVRHYMNVHEHIDLSDCRKCPKCDYVTYIDESNGSKEASKKIPSEILSNVRKRWVHHYNTFHGPPELFDALYQSSSTDYLIAQVEQDKVLKCKKCGFSTKICKIEVEDPKYIEYFRRARGRFVNHFTSAHGDSIPSSKNRSSLIPFVRKQGKCQTQSDNNAEDTPDCETGQTASISHSGEKLSGFNSGTVESEANHNLDFSTTDRLPCLQLVNQETPNLETTTDSSAERRNELATSKSSEPKASDEQEGSDLIEDYYQCWKCDFAVKVDYSVRNHRFKYRNKLVVHFNTTHNYEELHFGNPSALLVTIDGNDCFKCPKCDFLVKLKFNPEKHRSSSQSRKNARLKLHDHYFFAHCGIEKLAVTSISK